MAMRLKNMVARSLLWHFIRERRIVRRHRQVADYCEALLVRYFSSAAPAPVKAAKALGSEKVIWQYWEQGFAEAPDIVKSCTESVDKWKGDYEVIRLDDKNLAEYIEFPDYVGAARRNMSRAHFSDLLRVCLLHLYGGIWMDATVFMSGPVPEYVFEGDFFVYQRDSAEPNKTYWENVYAYYFGWAEGFRVNMLSSFFYARKGAELVKALSGAILYHWSEGHKTIPDYFFFQVLFDVLVNGCGMAGDDSSPRIPNCRILSDCKAHYLQQSMNDPGFCLAAKEEILNIIPIHKLTWK